MNKPLSEIQAELKVWTLYNFGQQESIIPIMGMIEELGELTHAHLKELQGIRKSDFLADKKDAIADITIYLLNYFNCIDKDVSLIGSNEHLDSYIYHNDSTNMIILKLSYNISNIGHYTFSAENIINLAISKCSKTLYLLSYYALLYNFDLLTIVNETWENVKLRDWKKYPLNGISE